MNTFTFDDVYFFDRQPYEDQWYAYTHPERRPFRCARFDVASCRFSAHCQNLGEFAPDEISAIEQRLEQHRDEMDLSQFDVHRTRPCHYVTLSRSSPEYERVFPRLRNGGKWDPKFGVAWETLTRSEPAYRLTRDFVSRVLAHTLEVPETEWTEYLREDCEDTWTYDIAPYAEDGESLETFYRETLNEIYVPTAPKDHMYAIQQIDSIRNLPDLYLIRHSSDTFFYYHDQGEVVVPVCLPPHSGWMAHYVV